MTETSFTTRRRPEGVEARPMGWWGTLLLAAVLATTYAAMYFTYVYVRVASMDWPPAGIEPPPLGLAALAALALAVSALPLWWASRTEVARALGSHRLGLVAAIGLAMAHLWLLSVDWARAPFALGTHAYASLYYVLPGIHATILAIGVLMALVLLALSWHIEAAALLHVGTRSLGLYWYVSVVGGLGLLAVVYLIPYVWRAAIAPG